jgi:hypothetical protein
MTKIHEQYVWWIYCNVCRGAVSLFVQPHNDDKVHSHSSHIFHTLHNCIPFQSNLFVRVGGCCFDQIQTNRWIKALCWGQFLSIMCVCVCVLSEWIQFDCVRVRVRTSLITSSQLNKHSCDIYTHNSYFTLATQLPILWWIGPHIYIFLHTHTHSLSLSHTFLFSLQISQYLFHELCTSIIAVNKFLIDLLLRMWSSATNLSK